MALSPTLTLSFPNTHTLILDDAAVERMEVGVGCFNGVESSPGGRLESGVSGLFRLKNNGLLREMKVDVRSSTTSKEMEISKLRYLKRMEIEGEKESKSIPFQPATSFVTNGTPSLEILNSEARCVSEDPYLQSTLQ